jgi:protease I
MTDSPERAEQAESVEEHARTSPGRTQPAGSNVSDAEAVRQVAGQTSGDLKATDLFARESAGAATDTEAAKADGDELAP